MISFPCIQQLSLDSPWLNAQDDTPPYLRDIRECAERAGLQTHTYFKIVSHIRCKMIWNAESTKDTQMSLWYVLFMCSLRETCFHPSEIQSEISPPEDAPRNK